MGSRDFGFCRNHQSETAIWYCRITKEFVCNICREDPYIAGQLIPAGSQKFEQLRYQLVEIFGNEYKNQLPPEKLRLCVSYKTQSKQTQIGIFTDLLEFDKIIPNDKNNNQPVTFVIIERGTGYSHDHQETFGEFTIARTENRLDLNKKLILQIKKYIKEIRENDAAERLKNDAFVERLKNDKESIYDLSSNKLMQYVSELWSITANLKREISQKLCEKCQFETARIEIPCLKKHLICQKCLENSTIESRYYCPIDFDTFPDTSIRSFWKETPKCQKCGEEYNLTHKSPKILPCLHTLCLECISDANFPFMNCVFCGQMHPEPYFKQSKLITDYILLKQIRCHKHHNRTDIEIKADTMKPMCVDCRNSPENEGAEFLNEDIDEKLQHFILERRDTNQKSIFKDVKHWKYSNQQMVALINWLLNGKNGKFKPIMRGTPICFNDSIESGKAVLTRFHSLMPPPINHEKIMIYSPWKINSNLGQIEVLTFKTPAVGIVITGLGISAPLKEVRNASVEYIAIEEGNTALKNPNNRLRNDLAFTREKSIEDFYFEDFPIISNKWYTIQVKINAKAVFRGNPLDKPILDIGSDGAIFEFSNKVMADSKTMNISYQNYLHGPIIKIYYSRNGDNSMI